MNAHEPALRQPGRAHRRILLLGVIGLLAFAGIALAGRGEFPPFALAFLAAAVSEVIITRAGSRWDGPLDLRTVCEVVAALAVGAALGLAAVRLLAEPATGGGSLSLVLGFLSGNFITDGLVKRRWWRLHDQTSRP